MSKINKFYYDSGELKVVTYRNDSGKRHRTDSPAFIRYYEDGSVYYKEYFINGKRATKEQIEEIKFNKQFDKELEEVLLWAR